MCRGFQPITQEGLKIKAFYLHLSLSTRQKVLPDSLTLHFLPRINGGFLEINGSIIRPDTPGFITLHRVLSAEKLIAGGVVYGSREKMKASEGSRFEIYMDDVKLLKGVFRKLDEGENWKMECKSGLEVDGLDFLKEADVCVAVEGQDRLMNEKVEMRRRTKRRARCFQGLEEIPEEREGELELEPEEKEGNGGSCCCCCDECSGSGMAAEGGDCAVDVEMEGVKWAVDVGIWVVCLGVGYLVTKASCGRFRHARLF